MADGVDHIDIYADVEEEFNQEADYPIHDQIDLYDDVISPSVNNGDAPEDRDYLDSLPSQGGGDGGKNAPPNVVYTYSGKRIALYIGNLTWWTTDEDLTEAIRSVGITDVLEIKFFENRANGQSKGFALVCVGSDGSSRKLMDLLSKRELHGQNPIVTPCNKQSLSQFEMQSRKSNHSGQMSGEGKAGPPGIGRSGFPMGSRGRSRFPGQPGPEGDRFRGSVGPGGPPPHFPGERMRPDLIRHQDGHLDMNFNPGNWRDRGGMQGPPRPPPGPPGPPGPPPGQGLLLPLVPPNRGERLPPPVLFPGQFGQPPLGPLPPGPPPPGFGLPPGPPPPQQGPPPPRPFPPRPMGPIGPPLGLGLGLAPPPHMGGPPPGGPPPAPHVNPAFFPPPGSNNMPLNDRGPPGPNDPYGRPPPYERGDYGPGGRDMDSSRNPLSEAEFEEIMNRNRAISSSAISRAVSDASAADYGSAIETLVTAISLIKQSKVSADDRCKVLISSLQDCLHGIESKSYGSAASDHVNTMPKRRERSRERDHSRSREKSRRHKSRSRDRHEDYYRERSRERDRHRERDRDRDREREREREYRHR
ncbi:cleavage and polyadenylation specificity factor subunit 6 isoform X1 [Nerophis lumbriciformis]|uniref:cleavage and polyadenylation specificity factor subunit 6 isoform X1 n=1 Tax=Nerophis lumbriciformis TaxID=546530 RepID=UPI002AE09423|nr:cleavage and polyadenylation specificity factor subunit 6-like isoform X1 [Nerophis lumbriciformis]XP_061815897.1 cleavage and polyadenylation specificity factor subunit 6-like isoform X1 [Nerophis lumbriciformis]